MENALAFLLGALGTLLFVRYTNKALDHIEPRITRGAADTTRNILGATRRRRRDLARMTPLVPFAVMAVVLLVLGEYSSLALFAVGGGVGLLFARVRAMSIGRYLDLVVGVAGITSVSAAFAYQQIWGEVGWAGIVVTVLVILFAGTYVVSGVRSFRAKGSD